MSVMYCEDCGVHVDTDFNVEHFNSEGKCARHYIGTSRIVTSRIVTSHGRNSPIPIRDLDWSATTEDYWDFLDAEVVDGEWVSSHPVGRGPTEEAAIDDLLEQVEAMQ